MPAPLADRALTEFIESFNGQGVPPARQLGPRALRSAAEERATTRPRGPDMHQVRDLLIGPHRIGARLYRPVPGPRPLVIYLHGGGWVIGDIETHDRACRRLAATSGAAVLSLDYRRAPEHPWPAAVDDALDTLAWIATRPDELEPQPVAIAIAGDSAGGTTAALTCLRLRDDAPQLLPAVQVLIYANTDLAGSGDSMQTQGHGYGLERDDVEWFVAQWVQGRTTLDDPRVSPLHEPSLAGLPPAIVVTCEHDPLRDQGEAYADRLAGAGVRTTVRREAAMVHNFLLWDLISPACAAAADRVARDVAVAFDRAAGPEP